MFATVATLVFVPSVFGLLHGRKAGGEQQRRQSQAEVHA
jgi:hypothetical protein